MENQNKEIDVIKLASKIIKNWKQLVICIVIGAIIGIIVALNTPKSYKAEVILAPELTSGGIGLNDNLAEMASNFGIDLGSKSNMDAIYPELYPDIFSSTDFLMNLYNIPVRLKEDSKTRTYYTHLTKEQKVPFWQYPKIWIEKNLSKNENNSKTAKGEKDKFVISKNDYELCNAIRNSILCSIDKKTSVISISVTDQDPLVAAIVADTLQSRLQQYITEYRTKKAKADVQYYTTLTRKAKQDYERARQGYGYYSDTNTDVILQSYKSKEDDLENDMQLKFNTYSSLNNQLQAAKAKVQERTPAFTILQQPIMPYKASSTPRSLKVMLFIIISIIIDAALVFIKERK